MAQSQVSVSPAPATGECGAEYSYAALGGANKFRLLQLQPSSISPDLEGILVEADLEETLEYEAVSYVWGDPTLNKQVTIGGYSLSITTSLHMVLLHLRYPDRVRTLWVDGICIDQSCIKERNVQVKLMGKIYSNCTQCLAYLGPEADDSQNVPNLMKRMETLIGEDVLSAIKSQRSEMVGFSGWQDGQLTGTKYDEWGSLEKFFLRPWFRRLWVVQECVLPQRVLLLCGKWEMDINTLHRFAELMEVRNPWFFLAKLASPETTVQSMLMIRQHSTFRIARGGRLGFSEDEWASAKSATPIRYLDLLHIGLGEVSEPRDRFYAILGLAQDIHDGIDLVVDYSQPYGVVLLNVAAALMKHGWGMGVLLAAQADPTRQLASTETPSWLPNWQDKLRPPNKALVSASSQYLKLDVARGKAAVRQLSSSRIAVRGHLVDMILATTTASNPVSGPLNEFYREACDLWFKVIAPSDPELWRRNIVRVMTRDQGSNRQTPMPENELEDCCQFLEHGFKHFSESGDPRNISESRQAAVYRTIGAFRATKGSVFGILYASNPGMFPSCSQPGDVVMIMDGSPRTVLLRPHETERVYTWLGEVYIWQFDVRLEAAAIAEKEPTWFEIV